MFLESLQLRHFRNYYDQAVQFCAPKTILVGDNAQGKSNVLEAVELLSTLRSHRVHRDRDLVQNGETLGQITATVKRDLCSHNLSLTLRISGRRTAILNGETLRRQLDLLGNLSTVQFSSVDLELVRGGPAQRRDWLDALLIQLEPYSAHLLQHYHRVLRQRNAWLKAKGSGSSDQKIGNNGQGTQSINWDPIDINAKEPIQARIPEVRQWNPSTYELEPAEFWQQPVAMSESEAVSRLPESTTAEALKHGISWDQNPNTELALWDAQLAAIGTRVIRRRSRALKRLIPLAQAWHGRISGQQELLTICYVPNVCTSEPDKWDDPQSLQESFLQQIQQKSSAEQQQGTSLVGPHRDEVALWINDTPVRQYGSQGQQRTIVLALKLAELQLLEEVLREPPLLLLDDVLAELDLNRQNQLLEAIHDRFQTLITTTHLGAFDAQWLQTSQILWVKAGAIGYSH